MDRFRWFLAALLLLGVPALWWSAPSPASGQSADPQFADARRGELRASGYSRPSRIAAQPRPRTAQSAAFEVTYQNFPAHAQAAFQHAVDIWSSQLTSSVPIKVTATWEPLGEGVLGSAGPTYVSANFPNRPIADTWYPAALANKAAGSDQSVLLGDIRASFSSSYPNWYFGTDGLTPSNQYDFVSVVLHEIGHGLGFTGSMEVENGLATCCPSGYPDIYDRFTRNGLGLRLFELGPGAVLAIDLVSGSVFWDGADGVAASGGTYPRLYAPAIWDDGSSYSHLDETLYNEGDPNSLMTPLLSAGEAIHDPGPIVRGILADMGWTTNASIATATAEPSATATGTPTTVATATGTPGTATPTSTPQPTGTPTISGSTRVYVPLSVSDSP